MMIEYDYNINGIVITQVRTYTRYGTGSVVMFDCAESPEYDKRIK